MSSLTGSFASSSASCSSSSFQKSSHAASAPFNAFTRRTNSSTRRRRVNAKAPPTTTVVRASSSSSAAEPAAEPSSSKFIPAHARKTVSRITEAQMKTNGVELAKASAQVQESIAGFLAFEFLRARVKNVPTLKVLNVDPPILTAPMFLSAKECEELERAAFGGGGTSGEDVGAASGGDGPGPASGLSSMKKAELVQCCEERGLDASGTVAVLRDRLKEFNTNYESGGGGGAQSAATPSAGGGEANVDAFRTSNPDALVNASSRPEAVNQLLKRLNYLFPDCVEEFESPSARKENKMWGIEVVAEAYKSSENVRASHAAYEQHEAVEKHYQVRANCKFFLNDSNNGGEITFPALPGLSVKPEKGMALIMFPSTAASLLDPRAATSRNAHDGPTTLNSVDVLIRGATPKILTEEEAAAERKIRHEQEKERARLMAIPRSERRKMGKDEDKPKNSRKKRDAQ